VAGCWRSARCWASLLHHRPQGNSPRNLRFSKTRSAARSGEAAAAVRRCSRCVETRRREFGSANFLLIRLWTALGRRVPAPVSGARLPNRGQCPSGARHLRQSLEPLAENGQLGRCWLRTCRPLQRRGRLEPGRRDLRRNRETYRRFGAGGNRAMASHYDEFCLRQSRRSTRRRPRYRGQESEDATGRTGDRGPSRADIASARRADSASGVTTSRTRGEFDARWRPGERAGGAEYVSDHGRIRTFPAADRARSRAGAQSIASLRRIEQRARHWRRVRSKSRSRRSTPHRKIIERSRRRSIQSS